MRKIKVNDKIYYWDSSNNYDTTAGRLNTLTVTIYNSFQKQIFKLAQSLPGGDRVKRANASASLVKRMILTNNL